MRKVWSILWRSLVMGFTYLLAVILTGGLVGYLGFQFPDTQQNVNLMFYTLFASGVLIGLTLGPIARYMTASRKTNMLIWSSIIFFNMISVTVEGYFFAPELLPRTALPAVGIQQLLSALICGLVLHVVFTQKNRDNINPTIIKKRNFHSWVWRFCLSSLSYVLFYMVFGFINYLLVTKPYYDSHVGSITVPELKTVVITELIRSVLIILSILPLIISLKAVGRKQIIACGLVLFVIGGIIPLLLQLGTLPLSLLAASGIEIFFQNFLTGAVAALLLGYPRSSVQNPMNRWKRYI